MARDFVGEFEAAHADTTRKQRDWVGALEASEKLGIPPAERFRNWRQAGEEPGLLGLPGKLISGAVGMIVEPPLELFGPQAPLTEKLFGGAENFGTRAADAAIKLSPLAIGIGTAGVGSLVLRKAAGTIIADALIGAVSGAASGAAQGVVLQEDPGPPALLGLVLGTAGGFAINRLSKPGRELARQYHNRPGRDKIPTLDELDAEIPHVPFEGLEDAARRRAETNQKVSAGKSVV